MLIRSKVGIVRNGKRLRPMRAMWRLDRPNVRSVSGHRIGQRFSDKPIPWKLYTGQPPQSGALTTDQIRKISEEHGFDAEPLLALSQKLTMA